MRKGSAARPCPARQMQCNNFVAAPPPRQHDHLHADAVPPHPPLATLLPQPSGIWQTLAGEDGKAGSRDGPIGTSLLNRPTAMCTTPMAGLVVVDSAGACVRLVTQDGACAEALALPGGRRSALHCTSVAAVWTDCPTCATVGEVCPDSCVSASNQFAPCHAGMVSTLAGVCGSTGQRDGTGQSALFSDSIQSITCLANCSVLVADQANGRLRQGGGDSAGGLVCVRASAPAAPTCCADIGGCHPAHICQLQPAPDPPAPAPHRPPFAGS